MQRERLLVTDEEVTTITQEEFEGILIKKYIPFVEINRIAGVPGEEVDYRIGE